MAAPTAHARGFHSRGRGQRAFAGIETARIHWPLTLQRKRDATLAREHLRFKKEQARGGILHCFVLDCSGSMLGGRQLALAQGALRQLHQRAYQQRARIALVTYAGNEAVIQVQPTAARPFNALSVHSLPALHGGGGTPIALGVAKADALLAENRRRYPAQQQWLWLLSDGRTKEMPARPTHADVVRIIDCEHHTVALNRCRSLAEHWQADYQTLNDLLEY